MKKIEILVKNVLPGSIAEEAGIEKGDRLISINSEQIRDIFDYRYYITNEELVIEMVKPDGEVWELEIEKDEYEDLGIEFDDSLLDSKNCTNNCIFCFIDQLPENMRETLYFKDDDSRLSFLMGNYITMTNMNDEELDRIIKYRMSPINISVHTANPELRVQMLGNRFAGDILRKIQKLVDGGITINCQIVLCRDVNDREELDSTISELVKFYPLMNSISVVPVGITKYREGLAKLKPYDPDASRAVVMQVEKWQKRLYEAHCSSIVYIADEFYIMAGLKIPEYSHYEDFPQIENGVGLVASLMYEFEQYLGICLGEQSMAVPYERRVSIATGVSAFAFIDSMAKELEKSYNKLKVNVYPIKNTFFGEYVTVTGLLTGMDLKDQLLGMPLGDTLLLCRSMLKAGEEIFLDDMTVGMLEKELNIKITIVENNGEDFIKKVIGSA